MSPTANGRPTAIQRGTESTHGAATTRGCARWRRAPPPRGKSVSWLSAPPGQIKLRIKLRIKIRARDFRAEGALYRWRGAPQHLNGPVPGPCEPPGPPGAPLLLVRSRFTGFILEKWVHSQSGPNSQSSVQITASLYIHKLIISTGTRSSCYNEAVICTSTCVYIMKP